MAGLGGGGGGGGVLSFLRLTVVRTGGGEGGSGVTSIRVRLRVTALEPVRAGDFRAGAFRAEDFFIAVRRPVDLRLAIRFLAVAFRAMVFRPVVFLPADLRLADLRGAALRPGFRAAVLRPIVFRLVAFLPIGFRTVFLRAPFFAAIARSPLEEGILLSCDHLAAAECGEPAPEPCRSIGIRQCRCRAGSKLRTGGKIQ